MTKKQKKKLKETLLKVVHIVCYVCTGLFIVFCIVGGLNSCKNKDNTALEQNIPTKALKLEPNRSTGPNSIDLTFISNEEYQNLIDNSIKVEDYEGLLNYVSYLSEAGYNLDYFELTDIDGKFQDYFYLVSRQYLFSDYITFSNTIYFTYENNELYIPYELNGGGTYQRAYIKPDGIYYNGNLNNAFSIYYDGPSLDWNLPVNMVNTNYTFNDIFAYTYIGGYENNVFCAKPVNMTGSMFNLTIFDGLFTCNGKTYNQIQVLYVDAIATRYGTMDNNKIWNTQGYAQYVQTVYANNDGTSVVVHKAEYVLGDSYAVYTGNRYWVDSRFKNIYVKYYKPGNNQSVLPNLDYFDLIQVAPSYSTGGGISSGSGNVLTDSFGLVGKAFASLLPILSLSIAPGITIGLIIFLPLLVGIIILIIKLLKR